MRKRVQAGIDGQEELPQPCLSSGRGLANRGELVRIFEPEDSTGGACQGAEIGAIADRLAKVARDCPHVRACRTGHVDGRDGALRVRGIPLDDRELVDRDRSGRELHGLPCARHRVGAPAADLDRAEGGRALRDLATKGGQRGLDRRPRRRVPRCRRQLTLEIVGRGARPKADRRAIALRRPEVVLDHAGRPAQEDRQHPGRERVQRPTVADTLRSAEAAHQCDHVMGRGPGRLREHENPVHSGVVRGWSLSGP